MKYNLLFFFKFGLQAQDKHVYKKFDSLKIVSKNTKNDTLKVNLLNSIASEYNSIANPDAYQFANESLN